MAVWPVFFLYFSGVLAGALRVMLVLYTAYLMNVRRKYSQVPSPKMTSFYSGHLPDILKMRKEVDEEFSIPTLVEYWLTQVQSKTFVVFFFHFPIVYTLDPELFKTITMNVKNGKAHLTVSAVSFIFGERYLKNGLFTIPQYDTWKPHRQKLDPAFKKSYLKTLISTFDEETVAIVKIMMPLADGKTVLPLKKYISQLTTDIISKVAFSTDFSKVWTAKHLGIEIPSNQNTSIFNYLVNSSLQAVQWNLTSLLPVLNQIMHPRKTSHFKKVTQALRQIGRDCIMRRIKSIQSGEDTPQDILTLILSGDQSHDIEDLVDDFLTFYVAGQETTANTIMFALILIHQNPNVLEKLQQEVREVLSDSAAVTEKTLEELQYTEQIILETLRMYPPVFGISKKLESPLRTDNFLIPPGCDVFLMGQNVYRRPEYFDDPDTFNPDRFHPDQNRPSSFTFFPFGLGHRSCIGKHFAIMESKLALARIMQNFTLKFPEGYQIETVSRTTMQLKDDLLCTMILN